MTRLLVMALALAVLCVSPRVSDASRNILYLTQYPYTGGMVGPGALGSSTKLDDNLIQKWVKLFNYLNVNKSGSPQSLNKADHAAFMAKLQATLQDPKYSFSSIAKKVADMYYLPQIGGQSQTRDEFMAWMTELYDHKMLTSPSHAESMYDHLVSTQPNGAGPLQSETLVAFEKAIGQISELEAYEYIQQMSTGGPFGSITKEELVNASVGYVSDPYATILLFGTYYVPLELKQKWLTLFNYLNIDNTGCPQALDKTDHAAFLRKLQTKTTSLEFGPIAKQVADMYYRPQMGGLSQTKDEFLAWMAKLYANNMLKSPSHAESMYDHLVSIQPTEKRTLKKRTIRKFEKALGRLPRDQIDTYLDGITKDRIFITKEELSKGVVTYMTDDKRDEVPLFGTVVNDRV